MQGDVWGPSLCATSIDSIGKECLEKKKYLYKYKNCVEIPTLAMIDDLMCISTCGLATLQMNSFINYKISSKKLQCGTEKCKKMHIGSPQEIICPDLHVDGWAEECVKSFETGTTELNDVFIGEKTANNRG